MTTPWLRIIEATLTLCVLFCREYPATAQSTELPCKTYYLDLSTGVNQETIQPYTANTIDPFWEIVNGPAGALSYPQCTHVISGNPVNLAFGMARSIAPGNGFNLPPNLTTSNSGCDFSDQPYLVQRRFKVDAGSGNQVAYIKLEQLFVSDRVSHITLSGPGAPVVLLNACLLPGTYNLPLQALSLSSGEYTLSIALGKSITNAADTLPLQFSLKAYIYADTKIFQDNQHYGRSMFCSPPYPILEKPVLANTCMMAGDSFCEVVIDNYQPYLTYHLNQGSFTSAFTFEALLHQGYKLSATDSFGCVLSDSVFIDTCMIGSASIKLAIQGWMQTNGELIPYLYNQGWSNDPEDVEDVTLELRRAEAPHALIRSGTGRLKKDGSAWVAFDPVPSNWYYHVIRFKHALASWSSSPKLLTSGAWYDYTFPNSCLGDVVTSNNEQLLLAGDLNQDESIDMFDFMLMETAITNSASGNTIADLNADGIVDVFDFQLLEPNLIMGYSLVSPP